MSEGARGLLVLGERSDYHPSNKSPSVFKVFRGSISFLFLFPFQEKFCPSINLLRVDKYFIL
jgi:hypothetical protein